MSQNFKLRSDEIQDNDLGKDVRNTEDFKYRAYDEEGHIRNVSFILPDGKRTFLNYAYLVSGECSPADDNIALKFTTGTVLLKGLRLGTLYDEFFFQKPMEIGTTDLRYNATINKSLPIINTIKIVEE